SRPNKLFNQDEYAGKKLQFLVAHGYEIGNHTLWHANLGKYEEPVVRGQIAEAQVWIQRHVPDYRPRTLALPHGVYPKDVTWAVRGTAKGSSYQHDAILMVAGGAAPSPFARNFDALHLPRIQAVEHDLAYWLGYFEKHPGERFVSDGDPAAVTVQGAQRDRLRSPLPGSLRVVERSALTSVLASTQQTSRESSANAKRRRETSPARTARSRFTPVRNAEKRAARGPSATPSRFAASTKRREASGARPEGGRDRSVRIWYVRIAADRERRARRLSAFRRLGVDEVRRPAVHKARPVHFRPRHQPIERLSAQERPHRRAVHEKALDALGPELLALKRA